MGFLASATTVTLTAKLTPYGRQQLLLNSNSIITKFSLGDSDANYYMDNPLLNGKVPTMAGEIGPLGTFSNGVYYDSDIKNPITVNALGDTKKSLQAGSTAVDINTYFNGVVNLSGDTLTQLEINRTEETNVDGDGNLFQSFGLPITQVQKDLYAIYGTNDGGFLDTAIRNLNVDRVIVVGIDNCNFGESIDGKSIELTVGTIGDYKIYGTYQKSLLPLTTMDAKINDNQTLANSIGKNVTFLFSDSITRPNQDVSKSWATGYNVNKPYSLGSKELFNSVSVPSTSTLLDNAVGVAYLDKGFIVITNQTIIDNWDYAETKLQYNHVSNEVAQNITCIIERDEFATSTNATHTDGEAIRVSQLALYDDSNNVIAMAKSNTHIIIGANQFMAVGVRILV